EGAGQTLDPPAGPGWATRETGVCGLPGDEGTPPPVNADPASVQDWVKVGGQARRPFCRMDVLLVEDDDDIAGPLVRGLEREGFAVRHYGTGGGALEYLHEDRARPDVVLLDLGLPDLDGFDLCRQLRSESDVPIIVVTARGDEVDRVVGLE